MHKTLDRSGAERARVLIVDDEPSVVELCATVLSEAGHEVETATRAAEAIAKLGARTYDVLVIDLVMPDDGGVDVIRAARRLAPRTPLIVMTAEPRHLSPVNPARGYYCLHKPFDGLRALEQIVMRALGRPVNLDAPSTTQRVLPAR